MTHSLTHDSEPMPASILASMTRILHRLIPGRFWEFRPPVAAKETRLGLAQGERVVDSHSDRSVSSKGGLDSSLRQVLAQKGYGMTIDGSLTRLSSISDPSDKNVRSLDCVEGESGLWSGLPTVELGDPLKLRTKRSLSRAEQIRSRF